MTVTVRFHPDCVIDVGERIPERRALVRECIRAFRELLGKHGGHPPGAVELQGHSGVYVFGDKNWRVGYTITSGGRRTEITIYSIELAQSR